MHSRNWRRRSILLAGLLSAGVLPIVGCGSGESQAPPKAEEDPTVKAKDSMDFYKNNMKKK